MTPTRRLWLIEFACVTCLLLLAAVLRLYRLQDFPAGYHNDEVTDAHVIETVAAGRLAIYFPEDTGSEPLYMYFSALFVKLLSPTVLALRLPSVFLAMLAVCAVWALTRRLLGRLPALTALAALGVSWWGLLLGRTTLHVAPVAPMFALAVYFFCRGCGVGMNDASRQSAGNIALRASHSTLYLGLSGGFFALGFNSYTAARVMPILAVALVAYLALVRRDTIRLYWRGLLLMAVVALFLSAPLGIYLMTHSAAKQLSYTGFNVDQPIRNLFAGKPQLIIETSLQTLGMFGFTGDPLAYYDIPDRPLLEPIGAMLFWLGVLIALWRWRDPRYGLVLIGWLVTLMPGMFSQPAPNYARTVGAIAFAYMMPGIGADLLWRRIEVKWGRGASSVAAVAAIVLLMGNIVWVVRDYFVIWPAQPETRWWLKIGLKEVADALNADSQRGPIAVCVPSHLIDEHIEWWRPAWWTYHYLSPRTEADARWYDCAESIVIPFGAARFAFPDVTSLDQLGALPIGKWMHSVRVTRHVRAGQSLIVSANLMPAWSADVTRLASDDPVAWPPDAHRDGLVPLPINFGHSLQLTAYDAPSQVEPGTVLTITTYWRVIAPPAPRLALFTHVHKKRRMRAQQDHLAITSHRLRPGDVFAQVHAISMPSDMQLGWYDLAIGLYSQDTGMRLQVYDDAQPVADQVLLRRLRVGSP